MSKLVKHHIFRENTVWKFQNLSSKPSFFGTISVKSRTIFQVRVFYFILCCQTTFHFFMISISVHIHGKLDSLLNYDLT